MKKLLLYSLLLLGTSAFAQSDDVIQYIKKESIGGEIDFTKAVEEKAAKSGLLLYDGFAYNKKDFAILLWSAKVKSLGIESSKKAKLLWEEINGREMTKPESTALKNGFEAKL